MQVELDMRGAVVSQDGRFRYTLTRKWGAGAGLGTVAWIMLNPSIADAGLDDPTIRRCVGFAADWGYSGIEVVNLFAFRATDPRVLRHELEAGLDVVGAQNDSWISQVCGRADKIIAAWGAHRFAKPRVRELARLNGVGPNIECLGVTKDGSPRHPLYVPAAQPLVPFHPVL